VRRRGFGVKTERIEHRAAALAPVEKNGQLRTAEDNGFRTLLALQPIDEPQRERPRLVREDATRHFIDDVSVQSTPGILIRDDDVEMPWAREPVLDETGFHGRRRSQ